MASLVGCIFHILDVHIINFLTQKRLDPRFSVQVVNEVDIYKFDPFELPGLSEIQSDDQVWCFFSEPYYRNASSKNPLRARAAGAGYWKSTGHCCGIKDKKCNIVGSKRTLVFYLRERKPDRPSKENKTNWVMHEFYVEDSPRFKKNFVFCYIEKQPNKKPSVSTPGDGQPSPSLASDCVNHVVKDTSTEVQSQELPSHPLISDTENHVTENSFSEVAPQPFSSQNLVSDSRNHVVKNIFPMVETQQTAIQNLVFDSCYPVATSTFSTVAPQLPLSYNTVFDSRNRFVENPMVAPQEVLPSGHDMIYDSGNHVAENTFCMVLKSMPCDSSQHQPMVDSPPPAEFGAFDGYNALNLSSFSAPQRPIYPEQGSSSSYSPSFSRDSTVWSSQFDGEHEDVANSQPDFQDENPHEGTEQTLPADTDNEIMEMINELLYKDISPSVNHS